MPSSERLRAQNIIGFAEATKSLLNSLRHDRVTRPRCGILFRLALFVYLPSIIIIPPSGPRPSQLAGRFHGIVLTLFSDSG
ncbi:MAG: hypothetical protein ORN83_15135, partial [Chthoniobacteraceae bacterium]|nr:hypothetical protein [Chthoniobacteraceae bacterium]